MAVLYGQGAWLGLYIVEHLDLVENPWLCSMSLLVSCGKPLILAAGQH